MISAIIKTQLARLTQEPRVPCLIPSPAPSANSRSAVVSYRWKYVHEVLVNLLGGLSLPRKSVARLTDFSIFRKEKKKSCHSRISSD